MNIEENVNGMNDQTEEIAKANEGLQEAVPTKETSTVLGKFKDVDALARAYENLQAEFTRRSQRLRTLEKEAENFKRLGLTAGAEKLRKAAKSRREEAKKFDEFLADVSCSAQKEKPDLLSETPALFEGGEVEQAQDMAATEADCSLFGEESAAKPKVGEEGRSLFDVESEAPLSSETLYQKANADEKVRLRIVGEYLSSLRKTGAPLTGGGTGVTVTPPTRAKTVGQAGDMALLYFRKPAID